MIIRSRLQGVVCLQALDPNAACSSQLAAHADAVHDLMGAFDMVATEVGDNADTWAVYRLAAQVCRKRSRGIHPGCCHECGRDPRVFFWVQVQVI